MTYIDIPVLVFEEEDRFVLTALLSQKGDAMPNTLQCCALYRVGDDDGTLNSSFAALCCCLLQLGQHNISSLQDQNALEDLSSKLLAGVRVDKRLNLRFMSAHGIKIA